ncbi:MAG: DMT family transporter [Mariniphaga sp.]|jgi:drug/metabolite transporter (DMT)-like permease|nr:DMT family transporter [Mariniphaga sp.]
MAFNYDKIKALLAIFLTTLIVGLSFVFVKMGLKYSTPVDLLADRLLVAFVVICLLRSFGAVKIGKIAKRQKIGLLGLSFLYPTGFFALQISGIEIIPATEASIIYALLPIFTLIGSAILLKEKTSLLQKSGALLSVLGVLYITFQSSINISMNYWGYFLIFSSLFAIVLYFILLKKTVQNVSIITVTFYILMYGMLVVNLLNLFLTILTGSVSGFMERFYHAEYLYVVAYLGVLSTFLSSFLTNFSLKYLPASVVGVFNNFSPVIGLFAGVIILKETLFSYYIYGGVIVLIGLFMSSVKKENGA